MYAVMRLNMEEYTIQVNNLTKVFTKQIRQKGLLGMIKSLFSTKKVKLTAVNNISFSIKKVKWSPILELMALANQQR